MSEPFIGEIKMFGGNFAPRGWALCNGQLLSIAQNTALFSILGTTYGGNGQTTFALPDLRSRVAIHPGQSPGNSNYTLGQTGGSEGQTMTVNQMPAHNHTATLNANADAGTSGKPANAFIAPPADGTAAFSPTSDAVLNAGSVQVGVAGGGQPFPIVQPYQCVNYIIALEGIFPSRN